jgi:hypothetical protein
VFADNDGDDVRRRSSPRRTRGSVLRPPTTSLDATDCDDGASPAVHPTRAPRSATAYDNDCDRAVRRPGSEPSTPCRPSSAGTPDFDGDGFGDDAQSTVSCVQPPFYDSTPGDCDDTDDLVNPAATEVCGDGVDNNCDASDDC